MKTKLKKSIIALAFLLLPLSVTFQGCSKDSGTDDIINYLLDILNQTGWLENKENMNNIPDDIAPLNTDTTHLSSAVDLSDKFPPIGDQGQYGTCVVWSVGYNLKTSLNAIEKGWTSTDLAQTSKQTSPKDLWMAIPSSSKGSNCEGTNFEPALDALIASGAGSLADVPYSMGSGCSGTKTVNSDNNKLANYRKIASETEGLTVSNFKSYLNAKRPVSIGARLGDNFMNWKGKAVIKSDTYNNPGMQHAYHAMVLVGYDDAKQAFRVRNSWGPSWGDEGSIWVDYNFFCNSFCFAAFVAQNVNSVSASGGSIGGEDLSNGIDVMAYSATDWSISDPDYNREFSYNVYNSGNKTIYPSSNWHVLYMLYNAKDGNDYKIIYEDYYTTTFGGNEGDIGELTNSTAWCGGYWNNITVAAGQSAGDDFTIKYNMPTDINGEYYLVVMADGYNVIKEVNEDNNFFFITAANAKPLIFNNGIITNMPAAAKSAWAAKSSKKPANFSNTETQTVVKPGNLNAYTPAELRAMLLHDKKTGKLNTKVKAFRASGSEFRATKVRVK